MRARPSCLLVAVLLLAACDSQEAPPAVPPPAPVPVDPPPPAPTAFSLGVTVLAADGRPAPGHTVYVVSAPRTVARGTRPAGPGSGPFLSPAFPSPWQTVTRVELELDAPAETELTLVDVTGRAVRTVAPRARLEAGGYAFATDATDDAGVALPGGAYRVRAVVGADTLWRWTAVSAFAWQGTPSVWHRAGTTGADGTVALATRAAVPAFFGVPDLLWTDETGSELGTVALTTAVRIVAVRDDGTEAAVSVTLADGPNAVTVRY